MEAPEALIHRLLNLGVVTEKDLRPCSQADIKRLERTHGVILPEAYKLFLRRMGRGAGRFLRSDHWAAYYEDLLTLNKEVRKQHPEVKLPETWFCFATRMGELDLYFKADGSDEDPPVYYWREDIHPKTRKGWKSFWGWFRKMVDLYQELA